MTEDFKRKLTAILSADVVGYSRLMGDDEAATVKTLETYKRVMSSLIKQHRGRVVDSPGDNLLAEFGSVVDAVQCAVSIQKELQTRNSELSENRRMEFRIGINLGDVIEEEDRIYGDGVNIAARLETLADPGGICISKTAFDYIENKLPFGYSFIGEQTVKNIAKPIGAYKVLMETRLIDEEDGKIKASFWRRRMILPLGIIVILAIVVGLYWNFYLRGPSIEPASIENMAYPLPDKPSIAVLPFTNMSGDPEQDYIGDGLSENITNALSVSSKMFVIPRSATFGYKGKSVKPQQVAEDFGVQYVLEGSIMKSGDRLRVTAQLIDTIEGYYLWADKYDREMTGLFELQDEITKKIVVSLQVKLVDWGEDLRVFAKSTDNLEAWKHYIKGDELFWKFTKEDNIRAREHFEAALELDPDYAGGISYLAITHLLDGNNGWSDSPLISMNLAFELAQKAVKLDDQSADAHGILGLVYLYRKEHEKAIVEGKRAITLNPNFATAHGDLATIMVYSGRFDEAITLVKKAYRLNPNLTLHYIWPIGVSYIFLGRYEEALELNNQMEGNKYEEFFLSWLYQEIGREEEARVYMKKFLKKHPYMSLETLRKVHPFKDPVHLQRILDALHKAGMPEKPPGVVQEKPSIAVLPFDDLSPEKDQEYFVLGLSEEILNSLAQIQNLTVIAKTSSFSYKGTNKKIQEIASDLGVEHILEGSVRKAGNALRITAQLIKADDESHIWSKTYDRELEVKEIFAVQEDIATAVAYELKMTLGIGKALKQLGGTDNLEAYELYLVAKGQFHNSEYSQALESFDAAIALDSNFSLARVEKASVHLYLAVYGPPDRVSLEFDTALNEAQKAIELEPNLWQGYAALGAIQASRREFIEGELAFQKAMELTAEPIAGLATHYAMVGYLTKSHELFLEGRRNDPLDPSKISWYLLSLGWFSDMEQAEKEYERGKAIVGDQWVLGDYCITILRLGTKDTLSINDIPESMRWTVTEEALVRSPEENLAELRQLYSSDENLSSFYLMHITIMAAYFSDPEFALNAMERSVSLQAIWLVHCWTPLFHEVRKLPQFKEFVKEIGLVDYWKEYGWPDLCRPIGDDDFECD